MPSIAQKGLGLLGRGLGFMGRHPMASDAALGGGLGAVSGFIGSGFSFGGALTGAAVGAGTGALGVSQYAPKKGLKIKRQLAGKLGRRISGASPDLAQMFGPRTRRKTYTRAFGGARLNVNQKMPASYARNIGGKRLAMAGIGAGIMAGAGFAGGGAYGMTIGTGVRAATEIGNTFGSQMKSHYGNAFSGMGNGTISSY
jgi:hypothetical protein